MNNNQFEHQNKAQPKRPEMLQILCILTFLGSGLATFSYFFIFISYDEMLVIMEELENDYPEIGIIMKGGKRFFLAGFFLYFISLAGAIQMWKLKKLGFHLYAPAQVLILLLPLFIPGAAPFSFLGLLITAIFIAGYASNLKFMT